ncbi:MAG TPA: hypothetical protein PKD00_00045 [Burkholderiales bacterium]|nr:hypothetical protein [Burkholderiales bacterium]
MMKSIIELFNQKEEIDLTIKLQVSQICNYLGHNITANNIQSITKNHKKIFVKYNNCLGTKCNKHSEFSFPIEYCNLSQEEIKNDWEKRKEYFNENKNNNYKLKNEKH